MESAEPNIFTELLPILVGGILALSGGFFGQLWTSYLDRKKSKRELRLSKSEALVQALYEHAEWLDDKRKNLLFRQQEHEAPSPMNKVKALQDLYFPHLAAELLDVMKAEIPMVKFLSQQRIEQMKDLSNWLENNNLEDYNPMYQDYLIAFRAMVNGVTREVHRETKN